MFMNLALISFRASIIMTTKDTKFKKIFFVHFALFGFSQKTSRKV